jgi:hypothetical protein
MIACVTRARVGVLLQAGRDWAPAFAGVTGAFA